LLYMQIIRSKVELQTCLQKRKYDGHIGFVPTMGALHKGHLSLVQMALKDNETIVVSIFINPTQFNDAQDFKNYPRNFEKDLSILTSALRRDDIVFMPDEKDMYPQPDKRVFHFGAIEGVMEGRHRPGHFNGVAQIVSKLLNLVAPDRAYFGQKDLQQLRIVQMLVRQLDAQVEIIPCPIIREPDGLAMSSRNVLLHPEVRSDASRIFASLNIARSMVHHASIQEVKKSVVEFVGESPFLEVEYFEIVNGDDLSSVSHWEAASSIFGCIAVYAGHVRLIDNMQLL